MEKLLKIILFVFLAVLFLSLPLSSESYYITEEQMTTLEKNYNDLETLAAAQKKQLEELNRQLETVNQSLQKSESRKLKNEIKIGAITLTAGLGIGFCAAALIKR